jgi:hypothetical protein
MPPYVAPEINPDDLSIRTDPIVSDIPDNIVDPADIPLITPTTPLELPELPNVPEKTGVVEIEPVDPDTTPELTPKAVEPTPDGGVTVTTPDDGVTVQDDGTTEVILDEIAQQPVVQQPAVQETPDGGAIVTTPETPVVAETPVVETPVVETPDGGVTVDMPDDTYVPPQVADTYNPDTMDYV